MAVGTEEKTMDIAGLKSAIFEVARGERHTIPADTLEQLGVDWVDYESHLAVCRQRLAAVENLEKAARLEAEIAELKREPVRPARDLDISRISTLGELDDLLFNLRRPSHVPSKEKLRLRELQRTVNDLAGPARNLLYHTADSTIDAEIRVLQTGLQQSELRVQELAMGVDLDGSEEKRLQHELATLRGGSIPSTLVNRMGGARLDKGDLERKVRSELRAHAQRASGRPEAEKAIGAERARIAEIEGQIRETNTKRFEPENMKWEF